MNPLRWLPAVPAALLCVLFRLVLPCVALALALAAASAHAQVTAVRVWPAPDSTRVTFESPREVTWRLFVVRDPDRVVLELDGIDIGPALAKIGGAVSVDDPLVRQARVGRFKPNVIRVVFDVKAEVAPQAFALKPIGEFGHRIVLDLFPVNARDPVAAFLERQRVAERHDLAGPLGGHDAGEPGRGDGVSLLERSGPDPGDRFRAGYEPAGGPGRSQGDRLAADVDHADGVVR